MSWVAFNTVIYSNPMDMKCRFGCWFWSSYRLGAGGFAVRAAVGLAGGVAVEAAGLIVGCDT
jgi:hypothetical protein